MNFGTAGVRDRMHHLRAVLRDAALLVGLSDHEARDVLEKDERHLALAGHLDEVRRLERRLGEEDTVVGENGHRESLDVREARDERRPVARLELVEARAVEEAREKLAHVVGPPEVLRDDAVELLGGIPGLLGRDAPRRVRRRTSEVGDDLAHLLERVGVVFGQVVGDARQARVHVAAAQLLGRHVFAGRGLHERRAREEDRPLVLHDDGLVRHRGHVRAACRARSEHRRDLRKPGRAHAGLVVEDAAEVVAVGKDLGLKREECAARVHEVDRGQVVLEGDFLRPQVLLHGDRVVGAALHGGVVGDDHDLAARDATDARHETGPRRGIVVETPSREGRDLEEGGPRVEQALEALAHGELAARHVSRALLVAAALPDPRELGGETRRESAVMRGILPEVGRGRREL